MTSQAALIAETIAGMKRRLTTPADASDSDESIQAPWNNGNKLKRKAVFVREGRLAQGVGPLGYNRVVEHAGYVRSIISRNPPRIDVDGFELEDDEVDSEADAMTAERNPYADIKLEKLLAPLTSAADLSTHPTLSKPYTSNALPELTLQARDMLHKERASLWRMKQLFTQFRGDEMWVPCGRLESDNDVAVFDERQRTMSLAGAGSVEENHMGKLAVGEQVSGGQEQHSSLTEDLQMVSREEPNREEDQDMANEMHEDGEVAAPAAVSSIEELKADARMKVDGRDAKMLHDVVDGEDGSREEGHSPTDAKGDDPRSHVNSNDDHHQQQHAAEDVMDTRPDGPLIPESTPTGGNDHHNQNGDVLAHPDAMDTTGDGPNPGPDPDGPSEMDMSGTLPAEQTSSPPSPQHQDEDNDGAVNTGVNTATNDGKPTAQASTPPPSTTTTSATVVSTTTITAAAMTSTAAATTTTTTVPHHMTTRLRQAQSLQPVHPPIPPPATTNHLHSRTPSLESQNPLSTADPASTIHPMFLLPPSTHPDPNLLLPPIEAEETRRLIMMYVQKQEEVVRGCIKLYEGLLEADRMRRSVFEAATAEGHAGEMSDGEDWVDLSKWGLQEGELRKGQDDDEDDEDQNMNGGRNRNGSAGSGGNGNGNNGGNHHHGGGGGGAGEGKMTSMGMTNLPVKKTRTRKP